MQPRWGSIVRRAAVVTFACACVAKGAFTEEPAAGAYRGTLGDEAVSVCLGGDRPQFYREKIGKTVDLEELARPGAFLESEPSHPSFAQDFDPTSDAWWELRGRGRQLSGTRRAGKGPDQAIVLGRVADDCPPAYEEHRLGLPVAFGEHTRQNGIVLQKGVHPLTGVGTVRVVSGVPERAAAVINGRLDKARRELDSQWVDCSDWEGSVSAAFVSRLWLVFDLNSSGFCGGIHPNEASMPLAFDAEDGLPIDFSDWIDARYWSSSAGVQDELRGVLLKRMEADDAGECAQRRLEAGFGDFTPWLGPEGFAFRLDETARRYAACDGDYVVPFAEMRPFVAKARLATYDRFVAEARKLGVPRP